MSRTLEESPKRNSDARITSSSSGATGDEKSREGRPQEDDTLSSILLMLKSNTNDDDDDVAIDDLETLANVGEDSDPSGMTMASTDGIHAAVGNSNNSNDCVGNGHDGTFATAVQTHMSRMGSSSGSGGSSGNSGGNNFHINPNMNIGSQKSSISRNIKIDDLRSYFHLPIVEVAKQLGICTTLLKRVCRTNKIKKWPYRQIRSIAKSIQSLEMASMNGLLAEAERDKSHEQITFLKRSLEALIDDPSIPIDAAVEMAMRTVAEDGTLPDFIPNADLIGDSDPLLKPTAAQVIAASVASSSVDRVVPSSKPRPSKRKKMDSGNGSGGAIDGAGLDSTALMNGIGESYDAQLPLPSLVIGESIVNQSVWSDGGKQRVTYLPPVQLTPLMRKKQHNPAKKLVPLIEPDICNCFQMDFLPLPLLRLSEISSSTSQVVAAFLVAEASDACGLNGVHSSCNNIGSDEDVDVLGMGSHGQGQGLDAGRSSSSVSINFSSCLSSSLDVSTDLHGGDGQGQGQGREDMVSSSHSCHNEEMKYSRHGGVDYSHNVADPLVVSNS